MKRKLLCPVLLLTLLVLPVEAKVNDASFPNRAQVEQALRFATETWGPLSCRTGEISAVTADWICLREKDGGEKTFFLKDAVIFVNGQRGIGTALRPIAPGFNFAACLYLDQTGVLRLVDGWYVGVEVEVRTVDWERRILTARPLDRAQTDQFTISPLLPANHPLPTPGEICYFLLDWDYQVRRIICMP